MKLVLDTSVFVAAILGKTGASREVLRRCLTRQYQPCMSLALFAEYRDVLGRAAVFDRAPVDEDEREVLFNALVAVSRQVDVYFLWRPNLADEGDNHVLELAVAAGARCVITHNRSDFQRAELLFPEVRILTPAQLLKED